MIRLIVYMLIASVIAACGLLSGSVAAIIASMIVSPLLQPITNYIFDIKRKQNPLLMTIILIFITITTGLIIGLFNNKLELFNSENSNMKSIADFDNKRKNAKIVSELMIAIVVGIGLPYAIINRDTSLIVAFGIAPSIAPPLVNCGLYLSNYIINRKNNNNNNQSDINKSLLQKSRNSFILGMMHVIVISVISVIYYYFIINGYIHRNNKNKKI
jgi:uncharacterized membrane protein